MESSFKIDLFNKWLMAIIQLVPTECVTSHYLVLFSNSPRGAINNFPAAAFPLNDCALI
jgi:hypothetical protein